jgi:multidrug efflux system membrane fusion protein
MTSSADTKSRRVPGAVVSGVIVTGAVVLGIFVIHQVNSQPRTDDAEIVANFIGIAPQVEGPILRLNVRDNQFVKRGDLLYEIDDSPYRYALEKQFQSRRLSKDRSGMSGEESRRW